MNGEPHPSSPNRVMKIQALVGFTLLATAFACSCIRIKPIKEAVEAEKDGPTPYYAAKVLSEDLPSDINGDVVYKVSVSTGCGTTRIQEVVTCGNSACCGVRLRVGAKWALPLKRSGERTRLISCQSFALFDELTEEVQNLVSMCKQAPPVKCLPTCNCIRAPCNCPPPCKPGETCINGICVNACALVRCVPGYKCVDGKCVPITIKCKPVCRCYKCPCYYAPVCPWGYVCRGLYCEKLWR